MTTPGDTLIPFFESVFYRMGNDHIQRNHYSAYALDSNGEYKVESQLSLTEDEILISASRVAKKVYRDLIKDNILTKEDQKIKEYMESKIEEYEDEFIEELEEKIRDKN